MNDLLRLLRYVRPYLGRLVAAALSSILISLSYLGLLSLIQPFFDEVLARGAFGPSATAGKFRLLDQARGLIESGGRFFAPLAAFSERVGEGATGTAVLVAVLIVALFIFKGLFTYLTSYLTRWVGLQTVRDLRAHLYARIQRQSLAFFSTHPSGQLISRIAGDTARLQRTVSGDLAEVFRLGAILAGQAAWLFYLNWRMAGFCLVLLPLVVYPVVRLGHRLKRTSRHSMERMGEAVGVMKEGIAGTRIVQAFGMEGFEIGRFDQALNRVQRAEKRAARVVSLTPPIMEILAAVGGAVLLAYASYRIHAGKLSPGEFTTFLAALFMIYQSLKNLAKINNQVQQAAAASRRVFEILDAENLVRERPGAIDLPPFRDAVEFRDVGFSYGGAPVLRDVNLEVRRGQVVALVGGSGSGKSTLVNLLTRFYDVTAGAVLIDGRDVRDVTLRSLREQIGFVTQEIILFDGTVRDNIAYGRRDIPLERVRAAAVAAHADGFISRLPRGYDTPLGEAGHRLSQGQRQRLSIARAILKDAPILVLDEATSSLDAESEAEVQGALRNLMAGRTAFVIAHRLATVRSADTIVVLDAGRIVERGSHAGLLARGGTYARLYALQFRDEGPGTRASSI
ncbi:MAG: ABC transporter ATP-binding protein [Acidobacteriota bacterium]